jgi:S1-C subfamily serine protease
VSVVRILGTACGVGVEGSGWIAAPGLVVTNAHVVAGESDTSVQVGGTGAHLTARAVAFEPRDDIAVLRVPALAEPALPVRADPRPGTSAAILGYPENGPYDVEPGRIGEARTVISQDAYGNGPVRRLVLPLRGRVRSGNSGGPMVDEGGGVVGTVFAATTSPGSRGGFAVPNSVVRRALGSASQGRAASTGPCGG